MNKPLVNVSNYCYSVIQVEMLEGPRWLVKKNALDFTLRDTDSKLVL